MRLSIIPTILPFITATRLTTKKLCINCKHFIVNKRECAIFGDTDLITGKIDYTYARSCRTDKDKCGEEATFYEENKYKFFTVPYYFYKDWWPIIYLGMGYSIVIYYYANKIRGI